MTTPREQQRERHSKRMQRTREKIDEALQGLDFEPSYLLSDGQYLHPHVECARCRAVIKAVGMAPFDHWCTHHRLRAMVMRWVQQRYAQEKAKRESEMERLLLSEGYADVPDAFRNLVGDDAIDRMNQPGRPLHEPR